MKGFKSYQDRSDSLSYFDFPLVLLLNFHWESLCSLHAVETVEQESDFPIVQQTVQPVCETFEPKSYDYLIFERT